MPPESLNTLILVAGAVLLGLTAVYVVRQVATKAEDRARIAQLETQIPALDVRTREALEVAAGAKRIASKRKDREDRDDARGATPEPRSTPAPRAAPADDDFRPGFSGNRPMAFAPTPQKSDDAVQELAARGLKIVDGNVEVAA